MTFEAIECDSAFEATQLAEAGGERAILLGGRHLVVARREADRLAEAGAVE